MGIAGNKWGFTVGRLPHGPLDKISDVPGVTVGRWRRETSRPA